MRKTLADRFAELAGREPTPPAPLEPLTKEEQALSGPQRNLRQLARVEESLHEKSADVLQAALNTFDLTDEELQGKDPPERWVRECGGDQRRAREKFSIARNARFSRREAPVALDIAERVHANQSRIKAAEKSRDVPLGAIVVQMQVPLPTFEKVQVVDTDGESDELWDE
jgi:hypothetical protein